MVKAIVKVLVENELWPESLEVHRDASEILFGMSAFEMRDMADDAIDKAMEHTMDKTFKV